MQFSPPLGLLAVDILGWLGMTGSIIKVIIGFSIIIFFHELGHYLACRWVNVRVHRFAVGFGKRLCGFRLGEGFTFGSRPNYTATELAEKRYGETDYSLMALPIGGYVKMEDHDINEDTGDIVSSKDPRAFSNRTVGQRLIVLSAGVVFNVLLAALLFVLIFMIGREVEAPVVGAVAPGSPAHGKLLPRDEIVEVNGEQPNGFFDIHMAVWFAEEPVALRVKREGVLLPDPIEITPTRNERSKQNEIGIRSAMKTKVLLNTAATPDQECLRADDVIEAVNGRRIEAYSDLGEIVRASRGDPLELEVRRPADPKKGESERVLSIRQRVVLDLDPADGAPVGYDQEQLLGLIRRPCVGNTMRGDPAEKAGFKAGDAILSWCGVPNPTVQEVRRLIQAHGDEVNHAVVEREGTRVELSVKPKRAFKLLGKPETATVGIYFGSYTVDDQPVVARIIPGTPAFEAFGDIRGIRIDSIDGKPVNSWNQAAETLLASAGRTVTIEFDAGGQKASTQFRVPGSLVNELRVSDGSVGLPRGAMVVALDGENRVTIREDDGTTREIGLIDNPNNIAKALARRVGDTVNITFRTTPNAPELTGSFTVRKDNCDPWQLRVSYDLPPTFMFEPLTRFVSAGRNPLVAVQMGYSELKRMMYMMYLSIVQLAQQKAGSDSVAGPIGIVAVGVAHAESGYADLMFFLALLSINLAVINLLPIPILDGGHILFLLIEKVKGRPLSFNTRFYTALAGLGLIILVGVFVTIQDVRTADQYVLVTRYTVMS